MDENLSGKKKRLLLLFKEMKIGLNEQASDHITRIFRSVHPFYLNIIHGFLHS